MGDLPFEFPSPSDSCGVAERMAEGAVEVQLLALGSRVHNRGPRPAEWAAWRRRRQADKRQQRQ